MKFAIRNTQYHVIERGSHISVFKVFCSRGQLQYVPIRDGHVIRVAREVLRERAA